MVVGPSGSAPCALTDLPLLPFPTRHMALGFLQTWNSYPILDEEHGDAELHCYGS